MNSIMFFSIKDKHFNMLLPPFMANSEDEAKRMICDSTEVGSQLAKFPEDYILCKVGVFASDTGFIDTGIDFVCSMRDIIRAEIIERTRVLSNLVESEVHVSE